MKDNNLNILDDIKLELLISEENLKKADEEIRILKEIKMKKENPNLLKEENEDFELTHQLCLEDKKIYNEKITKLKEEKYQNEAKISKLKEENEKLKKDKNINNPESKTYQNVIFNIKDLCKKIGLEIKKQSNNNNLDDKIKKDKENMNFENNEIIINKKKEYEKIINELKNKANQNSIILKNIKIKNSEYRNYLIEIHQYISKYSERLNISVNNEFLNNNDPKVNEMTTLFGNISVMLFELDDIIFQIENNFRQNVENILTNIQENINNLNSNENQNEINFKNTCTEIDQLINIIKAVFKDFETNKNKLFSKKNELEKQIKKIKDIHYQLINQTKKNEKIIQNNNQNDKDKGNINLINNEKKKRFIEQSFLYNVRNASEKLDLYKTINLFKNEDAVESSKDKSELIKKNYHEICYLYDDFEIHDIYFTLKAIGLSNNMRFTVANYSFDSPEEIEVQEFSIDDNPSEYKMVAKHFMSYKINLKHLDSIKVHIKYKATKNISRLSKGQLEERKIFRYGYYGLYGSLSGVNAKYSLILKGAFEIVKFENYFLIRNTNNKDEVEYIWGGVVPPGGITTKIMFSKKEAFWSFNQTFQFSSNNYIKETRYFLPIEFVGANNEIINLTPICPQASNIIIDEENRQFIFEFINTNYKQAEIKVTGELINKCKVEWNVGLTNEEIENLMPKEDIQCKEQLQKIAKKIIENFDKENKNNDFEFLDYMKIASWVHKNIKYDYNYVGQTQYHAMDIYNMRKGVCHHFTVLANALLYSLGYQVIYTTGYYCENRATFNTKTAHAYSLIKLENGKWYPFDATWGIFTGKLHVGHIFRMLGHKSWKLRGYDSIINHKYECEGKLIK